MKEVRVKTRVQITLEIDMAQVYSDGWTMQEIYRDASKVARTQATQVGGNECRIIGEVFVTAVLVTA